MTGVSQQIISDHTMITCYIIWNHNYEKGEAKHINGVWPNSKYLELVGSSVLHNAQRKQLVHAQKLPY